MCKTNALKNVKGPVYFPRYMPRKGCHSVWSYKRHRFTKSTGASRNISGRVRHTDLSDVQPIWALSIIMLISLDGSWLFLLLGALASILPSCAVQQLVQRSCRPKDVVVRKEWYVVSSFHGRLDPVDVICRGELTPAERIDYTDAVRCMQQQPQRLSREDFPGVRNRLDDFVA